MLAISNTIANHFLYVLAGTQLRVLESPKDILSWQLIVILSVLAFAPLLLKYLFRKRAAAEAPDAAPPA